METVPKQSELETTQVLKMRVSESGSSVDHEAYEQVLADRERLSKTVLALRQDVTKLQIKLLRKDMDYRAEREARQKLLGWIHMKRLGATATASTSQAAAKLDGEAAAAAGESMFWINQFKTTSLCDRGPLRESEMSAEEREEYVSRNCSAATPCPKPCPAAGAPVGSAAIASRTAVSFAALRQTDSGGLLPGEILRSKSEASGQPGDNARASTGDCRPVECAVFADESESRTPPAARSHPPRPHASARPAAKSKPLLASASLDDARVASGVCPWQRQSPPRAVAVPGSAPLPRAVAQQQQQQQQHSYPYSLQT